MGDPSILEMRFAALFDLLAAPETPRPEREVAFAPGRRFRFDFAWVGERVAVEIEGGLYGKSRHTTLSGYSADCQKYNLATEMGWRVLRYTAPMLNDPENVVRQIERVLNARRLGKPAEMGHTSNPPICD